MLGLALGYVAVIAWAALILEHAEIGTSAQLFISLTLLLPLHLLLIFLRGMERALTCICNWLDILSDILRTSGVWVLDQVGRLEPRE